MYKCCLFALSDFDHNKMCFFSEQQHFIHVLLLQSPFILNKVSEKSVFFSYGYQVPQQIQHSLQINIIGKLINSIIEIVFVWLLTNISIELVFGLSSSRHIYSTHTYILNIAFQLSYSFRFCISAAIKKKRWNREQGIGSCAKANRRGLKIWTIAIYEFVYMSG